MSYYNEFQEILEKFHAADEKYKNGIPLQFIGAIKSTIRRHENNGEQTIPIESIVNCLELVCNDIIENKKIPKVESKQLDKYMTVNEAAERFNIPVETIKNRLKPSIKSFNSQLEQMIEEGFVKYYLKEDGKRKEWIISEEAITVWFPRKEEKK
ncbi:hypothetical protein [Bacillus cereus]|uniref:hypothetical protein n=1 Tax=Bacillus cereus TaxID=1396 RepID=UPI0020C84CD6|nr:hypothetical protein [Bacillus cereus]